MTDERLVKDVFVPRDRDGRVYLAEGAGGRFANELQVVAVLGRSRGICIVIIFYLKP